MSSSSSEPEEGGCPCPCSCDCDEEVDQSDCSKNTSHSFGGNPDGADDCEGILEVGEGDSRGGNGGGSGGGAHGEGGNTLSTPGSLPEPSSPCPITLRYKHPLEWSASFNPQSGQISVKRPTGSSISFQGSDGHAGASVSGSSRKLNYKVQKLNADKSPCTGGSPAYLDMVQSNGRTLRFSASTGKVVSIISASGVETTAENYSRQMKVNRHPSTGAIQSIWSKSQGLLQAVGEGNRLTLEWYAPGQVSRNGRSFAGTGTPYKTVSYERSSDQGVQVLDIAEQREGMPVFRTQRRTEGNKVTTIQGEGEERTVRTVEKNVLPGGKWEMIESIQGINEEMPSSCMRTVKKYTDGGWLTVSSTRGYNTPLAQTTLYTYNDQFRVSLEIKPDGGYTRYEYDEQGRVVLQASPWAGGGEKGTRTTYADLRFNDFRPATQTEVVIAEDGAETELSKRTYTYEDTPQASRTTVTETALGSDQVHTSVEET